MKLTIIRRILTVGSDWFSSPDLQLEAVKRITSGDLWHYVLLAGREYVVVINADNRDDALRLAEKHGYNVEAVVFETDWDYPKGTKRLDTLTL